MNVRIRRQSRPIGILIGCIVLVAIIGGITTELWKVRDDSFCTSLWSAAKEGQNDEVETLLKDGHDPNCRDGEALKSARMAGHEDTVAILKRYGAKE